MEKILFVGSSSIDKLQYVDKLVELDDTLRVASKFTSDLECKNLTKDNNTKHIYYNDDDHINLDFKNNALLYIVSNDLVSYGVTLDEFYNTDVVALDIADFNIISDKVLNSSNILIVWIDCKYDINKKSDFKETKFLMDRIDKYPYLYFMNTDSVDQVCEIVMSYLNSDESEKKLIISENS